MQFRTKARAVDLLGKGQIADLPTAITELWKNGYDAYADNLKAELYKEGYNNLLQNYFIISDDGKGMSQFDILEKWLVLGTDSKSRAELEKESEETLWKRPRIKAGEKGIGRLSVAYLGNPMLMLTKKIGYPLQALYFDWRLLENYNMFLDDITIPIKSVNQVNDLASIFQSLKTEFVKNFDAGTDSNGREIWEGKQIDLKNEILDNTLSATLEPGIVDIILDGLDQEDYHGTKFLIFNPIDQILELSIKDSDGLVDREFVVSSLIGFTNPFKAANLTLNSNFLIHDNNETYDLITSRGEFFTTDDFNNADVFIDGLFDGHGSFIGKIRIYDEIIDYEYVNPRRKDARNFYGEIPIKLGYAQGDEKSSNLDEFGYRKLKEKVDEYGGLYIYRDDFRVLPYGRHNADFLNFEQRRSKRAGTFYFSHRRMLGYLDITRERNPNLKDKSSREGLINNSQYRAFTNDAINFFITLASDYFSTEAKKSLFLDKKKEINDRNEAIKADKAREKANKIAFTKSLNDYPKKLEIYEEKYKSLLDTLENILNNLNVAYFEVEEILDKLHELDIEYKSLLPKVPKRYNPTETQLERLYKYEDRLNVFSEKVHSRRDTLHRKAQDKLEIRDLKIDFTKKYNKYIGNLEKLVLENRALLSDKFNSLTNEFNIRSKDLIKDLNTDKQALIDSIASKQDVIDCTSKIENQYENLINQAERKIFPLIDHIKTLSFDIDEEQVQGAYKAQYEQMKFQWEQSRETAQLGVAVEIIDHEFNQLYAKINNQISVLKSNSGVAAIKEFQLLDMNFKQLEDKYALLSPLYRISGALIREISCKTILDYLREFFENQIKEYDIKIIPTQQFLNHFIRIKEPIIYTVFINIINNAIYWMRNKNERVIKLDYFSDSEEIIISNSGEKIEDFRIKRLFELFYSQRPNGRGIGLYLSKQSLNETGLDLYATNDINYNTLNGACFVIANKIKEDV